MAGLPSGVVTFVFTDIEGSTPLFERLGDAYRPLQERHRALLRTAWAAHGGHEIGTEGDGFFVAFADPTAAVNACVAAQRALASEPWPPDAAVRVRMGIHTGAAEAVDGNYTSIAVNAAARVMAAGNGGQIVVTDATRAHVTIDDAQFVDVGPQRLRGISEPMRLYLVQADGMRVDERPLRTSRVTTTNIVVPDDELIGRADEIAEIVTLVDKQRMVTITGTGGVGKTRLALAAAATVAGDFPDGAWFVDLHALRHEDAVFAAAARLMQAAPSDDPLSGVITAIGEGRVLLVLDNCEHLVAPSRALAEAVLRSCPNARLLVTSREPLGVAQESTWRAPSLPEDVAITLLTKRIGEARGSYAPSATDLEHLRAIAARLDGIPLALELAAARCGAMSPADVAARLTQRFRLLTGGRGSLSRHQTLEAAVAWSVELLDEITRPVFRRLAVFVGGWTLDGAEAVAGIDLDPFDVDDALHALVEKSLVQVDLGAAPARYTFLETVRDYAYAELVRSGEAEEVHGRHVEFFVELTRSIDEAIPGPTEPQAVRRFEAEAENVAVALEWALSSGDVVAAAQLSSNASDAGVTAGRALDVARWVERVLEAEARLPAELHARVLISSARVSGDHMHGYDEAIPRLRHAWELLHDNEDMLLKGVCAAWLGYYLLEEDQIEEGFALRRLALELLEHHPTVRAVGQASLGMALLEKTGDLDAARQQLEGALALAQKCGSVRGEVAARRGLAWEAAMRGDRQACEAAVRPLLDLRDQLPDAVAAGTLGEAALELINAESLDMAAELAAVAVEAATRSGNSEAITDASFTAGSVAAALGDFATAEREWTLTAELSARQSRPGHAMLARYRLAWLMEARGDFDAERQLLEEAKPYAFRLGIMPRASWMTQNARIEIRAGNAAAARQLLRSAVAEVRSTASAFQHGALVAYMFDFCFELARYEHAARLIGLFYRLSSDAHLRTTGSIMRYRRVKQRQAELAAMFDPARYAQLLAEGETWTLDDVSAVCEELTA